MNLELGDVLQAELVRRVMALEGREETLRLSNAQLETTVDALGECTNVSREDILGIARDLARTSAVETQPDSTNLLNVWRREWQREWWRDSRVHIAIMALVVVTCVRLLWSSVFPPTPEPPAISNLNSLTTQTVGIGGSYHKKALLSSAMASIMPLKIMIMEHYMMEGEFPESVNDLGLDPATLTSKNVSGVTIEQGGVLVGHLSESFGEDRQFKLAPTFVMGGSSVEWNCSSNLSALVLASMSCKEGQSAGIP